jgi:hypothetical protein
MSNKTNHQPLVLENRYLSISINPETGVIEAIHNQQAQLDLISLPPAPVPWRLEIDANEWITEFADFSYQIDSGERIVLRWRTASGILIEARIELPEGATSATFQVRVENPTTTSIDKIEYPILGGIAALSQTATNRLLHSQGTGFLFENPHTLFDTTHDTAQIRAGRGLRYSPYPEGFNGSPMQLMAYYAEGIGGFYLATHDATKGMKWLNFYKTEVGSLECTFMHQSPHVAAGEGLSVPYPVVIGALFEGNWYEAAERYKAWATQQYWTAGGTLRERLQRYPSFLDKVGIATFGVNAVYNRTAWLDYFHQIAGTPVFHVLGVNWPKTVANYQNGIPGKRDDYFPARFNVENLTTIQRNGDYWAPFEFDILLDPTRAEGEELKQVMLELPSVKYSFDEYKFPFVCPVTNFQQSFHTWRDQTLVRENHPDAIYYDISINNVLMACRNPQHGHPIGGGHWMIDACSQMYAQTKAVMAEAQGAYVPQGTEMVNEVFIPVIDYYQARAEAVPLSTFEGYFFRPWLTSGKVEKVPLFTYVYHEYGPIRMDGWSKLSAEVGDLFYWVASRVTLWGGLFEINCEFSGLDALDGHTDRASEHYYPFEELNYPTDPAKALFVGEVAAARAGFARDYLIYGTMQRPLSLDVPTITLDYYLYNEPKVAPHYGERGVKAIPQVVHAAWRSPAGSVGFLFVNLHAHESLRLPLSIDPARYGVVGKSARIEQISSTARTPLGTALEFDIDLPPRRVVLIEVIAQP